MIYYLVIFAAGFAGSFHCIGMCGGLPARWAAISEAEAQPSFATCSIIPAD
ncbi:hypothetical protein T190_30430 [Sinorhizobium meliloti CCBAU 01290]|nr:hypothetical protein T190_30430 [Sinorhizobium meliloti CCBAU 01290]